MHLYYELTKVSVVANVRFLNLVWSVPMKATDSHFTLFRLIALPTQISPDKFVKYSVDYAFFALQHSRRSYLLFTEADYSRCDKGNITICPAGTAGYSSQSLKCESSLFFQAENAKFCVDGSSSFTTGHRFCNVMVNYGSTIFLNNNESLCAAPMTTSKCFVPCHLPEMGTAQRHWMFHSFRCIPNISGTAWNHADENECNDTPPTGLHHCDHRLRTTTTC